MKIIKQKKPVIVLDAGGVLVDIDLNKLLRVLSKRVGKPINPPLPLDLESLFFPLQVGAQSWDDIPPILNNYLGLSLEPVEWRELWCRVFTGEVPGMRSTLAELKTDYRLIALSNTIEAHWTFLLETYPIFELLDGWVVSYLEGVAKPDAAIYQTVVDRYCQGRMPFFYTDDNAQYVKAAKRLGWEAAVFRNSDQLKKEIKRRM